MAGPRRRPGARETPKFYAAASSLESMLESLQHNIKPRGTGYSTRPAAPQWHHMVQPMRGGGVKGGRASVLGRLWVAG